MSSTRDSHDPTFEGLRSTRLALRRLQTLDAPALASYRSLPAVARFQSWEAFSLADAERLIAGQSNLHPGISGTWFQFAVTGERDQILGDMGLHCRADDPRLFEVGVTFDQAYQGHGYATEALTLLLNYAFSSLEAHRVSAVCDAENHAAAALFERLGFRQEGFLVKNIWFKGRWGDERLFAILEEEWAERRHGLSL